MNEHFEKPDMKDVRKCLEEADLYEPTMNKEEMLQIYQVVKNSKVTASEEERRIIHTDLGKRISSNSLLSMNDKLTLEHQPEDTVQQKLNVTKKNHQDQSSKPNTSTVIAKPVCTTRKVEFVHNKQPTDPLDSIPTSHSPLKLVSSTPLYNPPFYCNLKFDNLGDGAKFIADTHTKMLQHLAEIQRQSLFPAPWGNPIQSNIHFNDSFMRKVDKLSHEASESYNSMLETNGKEKNFHSEFETYVSQSGRQTKRKLYTEDAEMDDCEDWNKKPKTTRNPATKKYSVKKRPSVTENLRNEDIMKRSKLFTSGNNSRAEKMFDGLIEEEEKKKEAEEQVEKFEESLDHMSDENEDQNLDIAELVHSEEPFRGRVIPPSLRQNTKNIKHTRGKSKKHVNSKESVIKKETEKKYGSLPVSSTTKSSNKKSACPVCNEQFIQSELLAHASECMIEDTDEPTKRVSSNMLNNITCEACDQVLPLDTNYEVHVNECLKKSIK